MITHKFHASSSSLYVKITGNTRLDKLNAYFEKLLNNKSLPRELNIILDVQKGSLDFSPLDTKSISNATKSQTSQFKLIRKAIIVNSTKDTATALYYKHIFETSTYNVAVFPNLRIALEWLRLDIK